MIAQMFGKTVIYHIATTNSLDIYPKLLITLSFVRFQFELPSINKSHSIPFKVDKNRHAIVIKCKYTRCSKLTQFEAVYLFIFYVQIMQRLFVSFISIVIIFWDLAKRTEKYLQRWYYRILLAMNFCWSFHKAITSWRVP